MSLRGRLTWSAMSLRGRLTWSAMRLHLLDCDFRLWLGYWLGLQMFEDGAQCPADPYKNHVG